MKFDVFFDRDSGGFEELNLPAKGNPYNVKSFEYLLKMLLTASKEGKLPSGTKGLRIRKCRRQES